mgnify:CR=1 FL=1
MAGNRSFSIIRELSRKELDRHQKRFLGVTTSVPKYINQGDTDTAAHMEWVTDVRIDVRQFGGVDFKAFDGTNSPLEPKWGLLKNVIISQWAVGAVTDMNMPVLLERGESGRITVIARSSMRLPDITYKTYSYNDLGFLFMKQLTLDSSGELGGRAGEYVDAFNFVVDSPLTETGATRTNVWDNERIQYGSTDFIWGVTTVDENDPGWTESS